MCESRPSISLRPIDVRSSQRPADLGSILASPVIVDPGGDGPAAAAERQPHADDRCASDHEADGDGETPVRRAREGGGKEALRTVKATGRPPDLSPEQLAQLPAFLEKGAEHFGFRGQVWTRSRVGEVIRRLFGVSYSDSHVGRLIAKIDWSLQKPVERAAQRDEEAIERWIEEDWPRIKKKPNRRTER